MISESWSGEAKAWCEKLINRHLSFQFRENVQDVLPALPNPDDYFLLRWLRGEGRGGEVADEMRGQQESLGPHSSITIRGSQDLTTPSCFTCSGLGEWRERQVPIKFLGSPIAFTC